MSVLTKASKFSDSDIISFDYRGNQANSKNTIKVNGSNPSGNSETIKDLKTMIDTIVDVVKLNLEAQAQEKTNGNLNEYFKQVANAKYPKLEIRGALAAGVYSNTKSESIDNINHPVSTQYSTSSYSKDQNGITTFEIINHDDQKNNELAPYFKGKGMIVVFDLESAIKDKLSENIEGLSANNIDHVIDLEIANDAHYAIQAARKHLESTGEIASNEPLAVLNMDRWINTQIDLGNNLIVNPEECVKEVPENPNYLKITELLSELNENNGDFGLSVDLPEYSMTLDNGKTSQIKGLPFTYKTIAEGNDNDNCGVPGLAKLFKALHNVDSRKDDFNFLCEQLGVESSNIKSSEIFSSKEGLQSLTTDKILNLAENGDELAISIFSYVAKRSGEVLGNRVKLAKAAPQQSSREKPTINNVALVGGDDYHVQLVKLQSARESFEKALKTNSENQNIKLHILDLSEEAPVHFLARKKYADITFLN